LGEIGVIQEKIGGWIFEVTDSGIFFAVIVCASSIAGGWAVSWAMDVFKLNIPTRPICGKVWSGRFDL